MGHPAIPPWLKLPDSGCVMAGLKSRHSKQKAVEVWRVLAFGEDAVEDGVDVLELAVDFEGLGDP